MFGFITKIFVVTMAFFSGITLSATSLRTTPLKCVSINNQECNLRSEIMNTNRNEALFFPFSVKTSKYSGSCNNINDPYAKMCA